MSPIADPAPLPEGWTEGTVEANGVRLHYTRTGGEGPTIVLAHGVFDDGPCRAPLARELAAYDVLMYDARGHGRSDAPESGYAIEDRVADLVGLLDALAIENPILWGHSMGGDTVLATAAAYPDRPRAVVAVDPANLLHVGDEEDGTDRIEEVREQILWWHDHTKAELLAADDELAGHVAAGEDDLASRLADARLRVSPRITQVFDEGWLDPRDTYPDVRAPTLILRVDGDETQRARDRELADLLPDGRLVHVEGAGHTVFRDARDDATRELRAFLESV
jgi:pimeloyl-ACP methyl ester carboxylesterase